MIQETLGTLGQVLLLELLVAQKTVEGSLHGFLRVRDGFFRLQEEIRPLLVLLQLVGGLAHQHQQARLAFLGRHLHVLLLLVLGHDLLVLAHVVQPQKQAHAGLWRHFLQGFILQYLFIKAVRLRVLLQLGGQRCRLQNGDAAVSGIHTGRVQHLAVLGVRLSQPAGIGTQGGIPHPGHQDESFIRLGIADHRAEHVGGGFRIAAGEEQAPQAVLGIHLQVILLRTADNKLVILDGLVRLSGGGGIRGQTVGGGGNQGRGSRLRQPLEQRMGILFPSEFRQAHGRTVFRQRSLCGTGETLGKFKVLAQAQIKQSRIFLRVRLRLRLLGLLVQHVRHIQAVLFRIGYQRTVVHRGGVRDMLLGGGAYCQDRQSDADGKKGFHED